ncbi:hypothetical protein [uncultured Cellulomonas sp.]|uniref:hypothetical protein n=1 Tax=uncultured Cellulomonas sp. TaxID=189682 RepID=UPI002603475E|nr:hypothetical protein [uncultured Cellulomonas sp.]
MFTVHERERSTLHDTGTAVQVVYGDPDDIRIELTGDPDRRIATVAADLLCAAVAQARRRNARQVRTVLDASAPSGAVYLAALRDRIGTDIADIAMRRAGSSVLVTLTLLPLPRVARTPVVPGAASAHAARRAGGRPHARPGVVRHAAPRALGRIP